MSARVSNADVKAFWEANPVAAEGISAQAGTPEFFRAFDSIREADDCEPWTFSDQIHGYSRSAGLRALDVGCGNGYVLAQYARFGAVVAGVDLTQTAINMCHSRFDLVGLKGDFRLTDGDRLPFADGTFDIVCSMGVLHHIEDPRPMIAEMYRVLKPGGRIILMLYHRGSWLSRRVTHEATDRPSISWKSQAEALQYERRSRLPAGRGLHRSPSP